MAPRLAVDAFVDTQQKLYDSEVQNHLALDSLTRAIRSQPVVPGDEGLREEKLQNIQRELDEYAKHGDFAGAEIFVGKLAGKHLSDPEWIQANQNYNLWQEDEAWRRQAEREGVPYYQVPNGFESTLSFDEYGNRSTNAYSPRNRAYGNFSPHRDKVFDDFKGNKITVPDGQGGQITIDELTPEAVRNYVDGAGFYQYQGSQAYQQEVAELSALNPDKSQEEINRVIKNRLISHGLEKAYQNQAQTVPRSSYKGAAGMALSNPKGKVGTIEKANATYKGKLERDRPLWQYAAAGIPALVGDIWQDHDTSVEIPMGYKSNVKPASTDASGHIISNASWVIDGAKSGKAYKPYGRGDDSYEELDFSTAVHEGYVTMYQIQSLPEGYDSYGEQEAGPGSLVTMGEFGSVPRVDAQEGTQPGQPVQDLVKEETVDGKKRKYILSGDNNSEKIYVEEVPVKIIRDASGKAIAEKLGRQELLYAGFDNYVEDLPFVEIPDSEGNIVLDYNDNIRQYINSMYGQNAVVNDLMDRAYSIADAFNRSETATEEERNQVLDTVNRLMLQAEKQAAINTQSDF